MNQAEYIEDNVMNDMRSRLVEKLNEVRQTIISGDRNMLALVLLELDLYQKVFDDLYDKRL